MVKGYDEKKALKMVVIKLKKYASLWFENVEHERRLEGKKRIRTWSKLKKCMIKGLFLILISKNFTFK